MTLCPLASSHSLATDAGRRGIECWNVLVASDPDGLVNGGNEATSAVQLHPCGCEPCVQTLSMAVRFDSFPRRFKSELAVGIAPSVLRSPLFLPSPDPFPLPHRQLCYNPLF